MKKNRKMFILLACLAPLIAGAGEAKPSQFERVREMEGTFSSGERGRVQVTGDIFGASRNFPNDLRIFSSDGTQWPFFLHIPQKTTADKTLVPEVLNRSFVEGDAPFLQFDLVVPQVDGQPPVHNRMELTTSGRDFVRRVEVFTGNPDPSAGRMAAGYLIDFSRQRNARNQTIRYPNSDADRLHVRIYANAQAADETFELTAVNLHYRAIDTVAREGVGYTELDVPEREEQKDAQTQLLDLGVENRPVEAMVFKVADVSYARCVSIYGRNGEREPWRWVGGGEIHALEGDQADTVALNAQLRFLKVHVFHYDDQPLDITAVRLEATPRYLVFEAPSDGSAQLYYRAWDMRPPRYDLKGRVAKASISNLPLAPLRNAAPNEAAKVQPWRKYSKWVGIFVVGAVSLLVVWIIVSMLRQQRLLGGE